MKIYKAVFFWLGGVLTETVAELTVAELMPEAKGHHALKTRQGIRGLAEGLALGRLAPSDYCEETIAHCEARVKPSHLLRRIVESASLCTPIAQLVEEMPATYERWLIVDYPVDWYAEVSGRLGIASLFPEGRDSPHLRVEAAQDGSRGLLPPAAMRWPIDGRVYYH